MASRPAPTADSLHTSPVMPTGTAKYRQFPGLKAPSQTAPTAHPGNQGLYREGLIAVEGAGGSAAMPADSVQYYIGKARAVIAEIRQYKKFVGYLDGASLLQLPVVSKQPGSRNVCCNDKSAERNPYKANNTPLT